MSFLEILESYIVIDNTSVQKIRNRIFIENPLMADQDKSRRLIQEIHDCINQGLTGIDEEQMYAMRTLVLHRSVKDGNILITFLDIFYSFSELNLNLEDTLSNVRSWFEVQLGDSDLSMDVLTNYLIKILPPDTVLVEEEIIPAEELDLAIEEHVSEVEAVEDAKDLNIDNIASRSWLPIIGAVILLPIIFSIFSLHENPKETLEKIQTPIDVAVDVPTNENCITFIDAQELFPLSTIEMRYLSEIIEFNNSLLTPGIPEFLRYHPIDKQGLKNYLSKKNVMLGESPYFEGVINVSKEYDIHPLLMFAITGQEQGYVSKENPNHLKIANNPFNVYSSWRKYNTDIEDSTGVAAGTVITILRTRPAGENPFKWINTRYAEDKNWARGVEMIFNFLMQYEL
ncbi:MAG: hypothetical protein JXO44_07205 [Clostridia bacterium]|nr:hypothetical protein [Clostridia bacterium]